MFDYTTIMIARKEHEDLGRKGTPEHSLRLERISLLRRAGNGLGGVLIAVGERLKTQNEPAVEPAPVEA